MLKSFGQRPDRETKGRSLHFVQSRRAVAAIEFGLIAPVMVILAIGVFDLAKATILWSQTWNTARAIGLSATDLAAKSDGSNSLTVVQAQNLMSSIYAEMPWIRSGLENGARSIVLTGVVFTPTVAGCTTGCSYTANVAWSVAYSGTGFSTNGANLRPCGVQAQIAASAPPSRTGVPITGMTTLSSMLVVDVRYTYTPAFLNFLTGPVNFWQVAYFPPRTGTESQYTKYDIANATTNPSICPGYTS